jgi:two-component system NarL family sensor kinase
MLIETISSLFWLFITLLLIITVMMVFLCYAYVLLGKARGGEEDLRESLRIFMQGQEAERKRIALDLHDSALQDLRRIDGAAAVSEKIRSLCMELLPPDFDTLSFSDSIKVLCESFEKRTGITCVLNIDAPLTTAPLKSTMLLHCYRMIEEALNNVEKHARARTVIVVARNTERDSLPHLLICVSDDGRGLDPETPPGFGMRSMRERANMLGALLDFQSESGAGLMVRIEAPLYA